MMFHARWDPKVEEEGPVRQVWEVAPSDGAITRLSVTTIGMQPGSETERQFTSGLPLILSGLKSLLETDQPMAA